MSDEFQDPPEYAQRRVGSRLKDRWELLSVLGAGGSAWLYIAVDDTGAQGAVKVLHTPMASVPSVRDRFVREAKIANRINHPGVVRVLDDGECDDGVPFLVMELLEGETIEARAARKGGVLPVGEVLWIGDQVLDILHAAHKAGIVHRDIKPENIFLTQAQKIKLLDFGIARLSDLMPSEATVVGTLLGTLDFMAPEQARGEGDKVSVQTDLWAVGATLFRLLSGRTVHDEEGLYDQMRAVMSRPAISLMKVAPQVPEPIAMLIDFALAFDAPMRWPTARAMRNALMVATSCLHEGPPSSGQGMGTTGPLIFSAPEVPPMSMRRPVGR